MKQDPAALQSKLNLQLQVEILIQAEHQIPLARQAVWKLAADTGFQKLATHYVATAVSEMASNLVFHTDAGGTIKVSILQTTERWGIELLATDSGPGISDLELALSDGYSTRGGLGGGLGGIQRLMDGFELQSIPGQGTQIRAWKWQP